MIPQLQERYLKIIFSRKGFDASNGKIPSPVFQDGSFCSIPILSCHQTKLKDLEFFGRNLGRVVEQLSSGTIKADQNIHLDPDLNRKLIKRKSKWKPCFGQVGAAQTHLEKMGVGVGDLFLFFGRFRNVQEEKHRFRYQKGSDDFHCIFGWLQVGKIFKPSTAGSKVPICFFDHPHVSDSSEYSSNNTLYIASDQLTVPGLRKSIPRGGTFNLYTDKLRLTASGKSRSIWKLPLFFYPGRKKPPLSFHSDLKHWKRSGQSVYLSTVGRGQEFVMDCTFYPEVLKWVKTLLACY
ncbi:MAG: hypothetical protein PHQ23_03785 [Candidatus Wallbacteria bacterium]|nr:hypothetical protein [Candidatus Wallbacteria bacterium]